MAVHPHTDCDRNDIRFSKTVGMADRPDEPPLYNNVNFQVYHHSRWL
jgi:hypothetical protein